MTLPVRARSRWFQLAIVWTALAGCTRGLYGRDDLLFSMQQHHQNMRWGRADVAGLEVSPLLRAAFVKSWTDRGGLIEIAELEVVGTSFEDGGNVARVIVHVAFVERSTQRYVERNVSELWTRTDDGWRATQPLTPKELLEPAAPTAAAPAAVVTPPNGAAPGAVMGPASPN